MCDVISSLLKKIHEFLCNLSESKKPSQSQKSLDGLIEPRLCDWLAPWCCPMRGVETWGFHEYSSYPNMYCFLVWRESMESSTEKTLHWNTIVIGVFLNFGSVSHECHQYEFLPDDNVTKGWCNFFQQESHQQV